MDDNGMLSSITNHLFYQNPIIKTTMAISVAFHLLYHFFSYKYVFYLHDNLK